MNKIPDWMYNTPIAHRGYFDEQAPENSLKAFQQAIDRGFAIELDVQILKDNTLVVFHDEQLERMTGHKGRLLNSTYDEIKTLKLKNTSEKIPTLVEVLACVNGQVPLMVEFKNETRQTKLETLGFEMLSHYGGPYVIQSFNPLSVNWFRINAPHIVRGQLSGNYKTSHVSMITKWVLKNVFTNVLTKPDYVIYDIYALETNVVRRLKKQGMPIFAYTAKSEIDYLYAKTQNSPACFEGFDPEA